MEQVSREDAGVSSNSSDAVSQVVRPESTMAEGTYCWLAQYIQNPAMKHLNLCSLVKWMMQGMSSKVACSTETVLEFQVFEMSVTAPSSDPNQCTDDVIDIVFP